MHGKAKKERNYKEEGNIYSEEDEMMEKSGGRERKRLEEEVASLGRRSRGGRKEKCWKTRTRMGREGGREGGRSR